MSSKDDLRVALELIETLTSGQFRQGSSLDMFCQDQGVSPKDLGEILARLGRECDMSAGWAADEVWNAGEDE